MLRILRERDNKEAELNSITNRVAIAEMLIVQEKNALKETQERYDKWKTENKIDGIKF